MPAPWSGRSVVATGERFQIPFYLLALAAGAALGLAAPGTAPTLEQAINPVLIVLLYATFLAVPFARIGAALRDVRFLVGAVALNFVVVPVVVFALTRFVADDRAVLVGVVLVLCAPCIDYVIVFSGLAGAASDRLLAGAPVLMLLQIALLPLYLWLFVGADVVDTIEVAPFVEAFLVLIVVPMALAATTQVLARRHRLATRVTDVMAATMVPIMMVTLAVVVASQIDAVRTRWADLVGAAVVFVAFLVVMAVLGRVAAGVARLDVPAGRALVFSGATRNSLVVLPLALALPSALALAPVVVVTQTLVELVGMIAYVRLVPRLIPAD
ncbi:arsenic resistance protein [Williamsia phyllosphaerae]|uniref:Arsenic resistance protein n=1 Tax=Williamsia phyllosphaerae TaxID=885042 RepID=A0ABQ1V044_9NOCA|nr:arsenic resistance protein [Williamsia phyllosphaerae]GGF32013.1 arsenic resistance protein [Williamsia phyllosphaerae]